MKSTALYRHFDASGALLYVGITGDLAARTTWHSKNSAWFPDVRDTTISWIADRSDALVLEAAAIRIERPMHNKVHNVAVTNEGPISGFISAVGVKALASDTDLSVSAITNWPLRGFIPAKWALLVAHHCERIGLTVPLSCFPWRGAFQADQCVTTIFGDTPPCA